MCFASVFLVVSFRILIGFLSILRKLGISASSHELDSLYFAGIFNYLHDLISSFQKHMTLVSAS